MGGATETNVCEMKAHFEVDGPNGTHMCMVFELLGDDLLALIQKHDYKGIPISTVQHITFQMCEAFAFLHEQCAIIHTDLKPENLLLKPAIDVLALDIKKVQAIRASSDTSPTRRKKLKKQIKRMKHRAKARERAVSNNSDSTGPVSPRSLNTKGWQGPPYNSRALLVLDRAPRKAELPALYRASKKGFWSIRSCMARSDKFSFSFCKWIRLCVK